MESLTNTEPNMGGEDGLDVVVVGEVDIYESFEDMDLNDSLLRGIFAYGYEKPSIIQQKAIKPLMEGKDIIAQAQSGTGKTATFTIGMLQTIDSEKYETQAIISI